MKNIEVWIFLLIAFFLGTWGALFNTVQTVLIALGFVYNVVKYKDEFFKNLKAAKYYILLPVIYMVYLAIHTLIIVNSGKYMDLKPRFGIFEPEFFFFLLGALYVLSAKSFVTLHILKQFLLTFCISVFTFNFVMLFYVTGVELFTNTSQAILYLYDSRFGFTKELLGGQVYLDAQALQIYAAALIAYFFGIAHSRYTGRIFAFIGFAVFVWFLSLTVTKSSILSFICGFILFNLYFFRRLSVRYRWGLAGAFLLIIVSGYFFRPSSFDVRWQQMKNEINDVQNDRLEGGGSITPRIVFYKSCFDNIDLFGVWGLGVYTNPVSKQWYLNSGNSVVAQLTHSHNSYLQYWMIGGIIGLLYILSWFIIPLVNMYRTKHYSFLALSIMLAFFIDANFEVLLIVSDATPVIIFFLAMFYLYDDKFYALENSTLLLDKE